MAWRVLAGVFDWWADEGIRDIGRERFHRRRGSDVSGTIGSPGTTDSLRFAFVAQRSPWRLAEVYLRSPDDPPLAVVAWADRATAVLKGQPAEQHLVQSNESFGDGGLKAMLEPGRLETLVGKPWSPHFRVNGELLDRDWSLLPEFLSLGTDYYEARYDAGLDALRSWTAFIDEAPAARLSLSRLNALDDG